MSILSVERICLQATAGDKIDAIRQAGALLVNTGCVAPEYVDGMLARRAHDVYFPGQQCGHPSRRV